MPILVEIGPVFLEKMKMCKVYDDNKDITKENDDRQQINCDQKSSL